MTTLTASCSGCHKEITGTLHSDYDDVHWCSLCYYKNYIPWFEKEYELKKEKIAKEQVELQELKVRIDRANLVYEAAKSGDLGEKDTKGIGYGKV